MDLGFLGCLGGTCKVVQLSMVSVFGHLASWAAQSESEHTQAFVLQAGP